VHGCVCDLNHMAYSRIKLDSLGFPKEEVVAGRKRGKVLFMPRRKRTRRVRLTQPCGFSRFAGRGEDAILTLVTCPARLRLSK